jgi:N-acetyl-anhydromuramyl-L-alanine amidase AmpD
MMRLAFQPIIVPAICWVGAVHATPALNKQAVDFKIIDRPIRFDNERIELTKQYIRKHYGLSVKDIKIVPKAVVVHWTGTSSLKAIWRGFNRVRLRTSRRHIIRGGALNVSAHFLVGRDGTIYRLMPENWMARHCIGLNYDSIGIENVGDGKRYPLTDKQLAANARLVRYLVGKHPIRYLLGHMEWKRFEKAPFFRELDPTYRNAKADPGARFMRRLRSRLKRLDLKGSYKKK